MSHVYIYIYGRLKFLSISFINEIYRSSITREKPACREVSYQGMKKLHLAWDHKKIKYKLTLISEEPLTKIIDENLFSFNVVVHDKNVTDTVNCWPIHLPKW